MKTICYALALLFLVSITNGLADVYQVGLGIADVTGPVAEVNFMGYAKVGQDGSGIHLRLFSRAYYIEDSTGSSVLYIHCDIHSFDHLIRKRVLDELERRYPNKFTEKNVMMSATHTHSGPGGYLQYFLFTVLSQGFNRQSMDAIVDGIITSVDRAHATIIPTKLYLAKGELSGTSINRSPASYLLNPKSERDQYKSNVDTTMTVLKFVNVLTNEVRGIISWFPVHPVSMNNSNTLVSSDNKGLASLLVEQELSQSNLPADGTFIASFSNTNAGDVSPNTKGPRCIDTGDKCDFIKSTCSDGKTAKCIAFGPGETMEESTRIIAQNQANLALKLIRSNASDVAVRGAVKSVHEYVDMSKLEWKDEVTNETFKTCPHAMGYSFAAGTTDGPGAFDFRQGQTNGTCLWNFVRNRLAKPDEKLIKCHLPKPILLATGYMKFPLTWAPSILPTQVMTIGQLVIAAVPGEPTTMSGRRIVRTIKQTVSTIDSNFANEITVIPHGYTNGYSDYIATYEEYQLQRYEGANTAYGPRTLDAYLRQFAKLTKSVLTNLNVPSGPEPANLLKNQIRMKIGVIRDGRPLTKKFGQVKQEPKKEYKKGQTVKVTFVAGHPNNKILPTYLTVEKKMQDGSWKVVANDASIDTKFHWKRDSTVLGTSTATVEWIAGSQGVYRINYFGTRRSLLGKLKDFSGQSEQLTVEA